MKLVTQYIIQNLVDNQDQSAKIFKMLEQSGFNQQEINSTIACITFIIENASKYDVPDTTLTKELIDLGLPKENCEQLSKTFKSFKDKLQITYQSQILKIGKLGELHYGVSKFVVSDSVAPLSEIEGNKFVDVSLKSGETHEFIIFPELLNDMLNSFKRAQNVMMQY